MNTPNLPAINLKPKDRVAMAIIAGLLIALVAIPVLTWFAAVTALLATIVANTVYSLLTIGGLIIMGMSLWENRTNILYKWKNMSRNVARGIARENPLGVMDTAIARFEKKLTGEIGPNLTKASAAAKRQHEAIRATEAEQVQQEGLLTTAQRQGRSQPEIERYALAAERRRKSVENMRPLAELLDQVFEKLTQAREVCISKLEDMKDQRVVFGREYESMMAGQKAVSSFRSFFASNPDLEMLQLSIEEIDKQTAEAEADIDQFMRDIQPAISAAQLQKSADAQAALDRITGSKLLSGESASNRLIEAPVKEGVLVGK